MHAFHSLCITLVLLAMAGADDTKALSLMREANDQFTAKFFSEKAKESSNSSFVISAFSVFTPLSLLSIASSGRTHDELLTTLGFQNDEDLKEATVTVTTNLRSMKGIDIKMANRIYIPLGYELSNDFHKTAIDVFDSEVKNADFHDPDKTVAEINGWVESQTNNKIKDLVTKSNVDDDTRALLVNALYFKGKWDVPFDKSLTKNGKFYKSNSDTTEVSYMFMSYNKFNYKANGELDAKILEMSYAGNEASFLIILPNNIDGLDALETKLKDPAVLKKAVHELYPVKVDVTIPKFTIETTTDLQQILKKIGIDKIFSMHAEITKLLQMNELVYVSSATQKAFIEINEEGTEAAASNVAIMVKTASLPQIFKADHPFMFMVKHRDMILFSGVYKS